MGLGDVYLGAPVATPLDPRHRLVTTKYNPARTWTPENAVGIGGAYLCVYGMEGPGGYQFVGRTVQMWNRYRGQRGLSRRQAMAAALLRPDPLLSGERRGIAAHARGLSVRQASAAHRGDDSLTSANTVASSRRKRESIDAFRAPAARGLRGRARTLARRGGFRGPRGGKRRASQPRPRCPPDCVAVTSPVSGSVWQIKRRGRTARADKEMRW